MAQNYTGLYINILELEMMHPHNCGLALRIFNKFCTMKEAVRYMPIIWITFPKFVVAYNSASVLMIFLFWQNERH